MRRVDMERWDLPPPRLGELREAGIAILMSCPICRAAWRLDPAQAEGDDAMPVRVLATRLTCACGRRGGLGAVPDNAPWVRWLRKTGQRKRLPWSAAFVKDDAAD